MSAAGLTVTVYGGPAPQGSKRYLGAPGGKGRMIEQSKRVAPWRAAVVNAARQAIEVGGHNDTWQPLDGPLLARIVFTLRKPASAPKRRRTWPDRTPDLSKLLRATEDALKDAGAIADDARIIEYTRLAKVYPGEDPEALDVPGAWISIGTRDWAGIVLRHPSLAARLAANETTVQRELREIQDAHAQGGRLVESGPLEAVQTATGEADRRA
jgi:Holliday junction resolvase RusA-like endonuclease